MLIYIEPASRLIIVDNIRFRTCQKGHKQRLNNHRHKVNCGECGGEKNANNFYANQC